VLTQRLPDLREIGFAYDANGNVTSLTPPGRPAHAFSYTPVDLTSTYTPPSVTGGGATLFGYDRDRALASISRPDGTAVSLGPTTRAAACRR